MSKNPSTGKRVPPKSSQDASDQGARQRQPLQHPRRINAPARINEREIRRPENLPEIEPYDLAGQQAALEPGQFIGRTRRADQVPLDRGREQAGDRAQHEPGDQRQHIGPPVDPPATPPGDHEQGRRQGGDNRLRQQTERKQTQRAPVMPAPAVGVESQPGQRGAEKENRGESVFLLADPGDRFDVDGMKGEDSRGEPRTGNREPAQQQSEETRGEGMQRQICQMVAERGIAPETVLDPEQRMQQRIILLGNAWFGPDAPQTGHRTQRGRSQMGVVVPDEARPPDRLIGGQHGDGETEGGEPGRQGETRRHGAMPGRRNCSAGL
jgi:hypothetical protein